MAWGRPKFEFHTRFYQEPLPELGELEILGKVKVSVSPMVTNKPPLVQPKMLARVVVAERPALAELDFREQRRRPAVVGVAPAVTHPGVLVHVRRRVRVHPHFLRPPHLGNSNFTARSC